MTRSLTPNNSQTNLCPMKPPIYLTAPKEMLKVRLNQPRTNSEQARAQRERLRRAAEKFSEDARNATSSPGRAKTAA